jgi:hypothetical protein
MEAQSTLVLLADQVSVMSSCVLIPLLTLKSRNRVAGRLMYLHYFKATEAPPRLGTNLLPIVWTAGVMERAGASPSSRRATVIEIGCPC